MLILPVLGALMYFNRDTPVLVAIPAVVAAACVCGVLLYIARARVYVTGTRIGKRGFGATRWVARAAVHRSLLVKKLTTAGAASESAFFLFAPDGVRVMRLSGSLWTEADLVAIAEAAGAEQSVRAMPVSTTQLGLDEPTALNWFETHPKETTWITVVAVLAIAIPIAIIVVTAL